MRLFAAEHVFPHPWEAVSKATWQKYPSEAAPHVAHVDYIARHVEPSTGALVTERLLAVRQPLPALVRRVFRALSRDHELHADEEGPLAFFLERSVVDARGRRAVLVSRNLSMASILAVEERCVYEPAAPQDMSESSGHTVLRQEARVSAQLPGWWASVRDSVESFCVARFSANTHRGRAALEEAVARVCSDAGITVYGVPPEDASEDSKPRGE